MELGFVLVEATPVFSLPGRILMFSDSAMTERGPRSQAAGAWVQALAFTISGTWSKTPLFSAFMFPPAEKIIILQSI